jgi:hypothetical protein
MNPRLLMVCAIGLSVAWAARAEATQAPAPGLTTAHPNAVSAASRKRKRHDQGAARAPAYQAPAYYVAPRPYRRIGADPSFGPDGKPYKPPVNLGYCVIDEGYGRFSACPNR